MTETGSAAVVGGGPAGLFAAERLAEAGFSVTVYDHRRSVGRKFLLAGRSGLNLTYDLAVNDADVNDADTPFPGCPPVIASAIDRFGPADLRDWAAGLGTTTFTGTSGRVFPQAMRATPLLRAWLERLDRLGVEVQTEHRWTGFGVDAHTNNFEQPFTAESIVVRSDVTVMALGGASWPRVGSDGSWVSAFEAAGIAVVPLTASNCGLAVRFTEHFLDRFAGTPIKDVCASAGSMTARGDVVVTSTGFEGGPVYAIGPAVRAALTRDGNVNMHLDLRPDLDLAALTDRLGRARPKDSRSTALRKAGFGPAEIGLLREATGNSLPNDASSMASLAKSLPITVAGLASIDRAISTDGGVALDAVDDTFMLLDRPDTYVAGEMLDWDAPTGGFLLQTCFATAAIAADAAIDRISAPRFGGESP